MSLHDEINMLRHDIKLVKEKRMNAATKRERLMLTDKLASLRTQLKFALEELYEC